MNWTAEQLQSYYDRLKQGGDAICGQDNHSLVLESPCNAAPVGTEAGAAFKSALKHRMNRWETEYAGVLDARRMMGGVVWWGFEAIKLRLADNTYYTPDFAVITNWEAPNDIWVRELEFHEVKGFWRDDARVKIKVSAELFPFKFIAVQKLKKSEGGGWKVEEFGGRG